MTSIFWDGLEEGDGEGGALEGEKGKLVTLTF